MKIAIGFIISAATLSCNESTPKEREENTQRPIEGTWELISGSTIEKGDTTVTDYTRGQKMIKIINATHFAFLRHDLNKGKDSAIFSSGGGSYSLVDSQYIENLEYCSEREWEGNIFNFTVSVRNDTLIQTGIEKLETAGIDRLIIERYRRVK